jgi:lauroyl-KDO2-lipid IV(A) myristoyltransferase
MKQPTAIDNAGQSALLYDTRFSWHYLKPMYWPTWLAILLLWLVMWLPVSLQDVLANRLGDLARNINAKRRRIARKNLELCFPELSQAQRKQMLRASFRHQARSVLSFGLFWWAPQSVLQKRIRLEGEAHINASLEKGRGVIFMAAHSFALEAAVSATTMRYPLSGPFNPMKNKLVDWFVARGRKRHGTFIYPRSAGLRPIIKDARAGCTLFYLPDEDLGKDRCIFVPFFGIEKATVPVLGRLAKSCRADVLPTIACYDESRHCFVIHVLPALQDFPRGDDYADSLVMNQQLEKIIRLCPEQYFWIMKLFKTRPPDQPKFY